MAFQARKTEGQEPAKPEPPKPNMLAIVRSVTLPEARAGVDITLAATLPLTSSDMEIGIAKLERRYDVFERFGGRSSLRTYLTAVVKRLLLDWRNETYGKWRSSAVAIRLGREAVALDRLMHRDGCTPGETIETLAGPRLDDPIDLEERRRAAQHLRGALARALHSLSTEDRRLVRARYQQERPVTELAPLFQTDPKSLYRRCDRVLRSLRQALATEGLTGLPS